MNKKAFTLIELLVVVLIIGILASIAVPKYTKIITKAKAQEAIANIDALSKGVAIYYNERGSYEGLTINDLAITMADNKNFTYNFSYGQYVSHLSAVRNDKDGNPINGNHPMYFEIQYTLEDGEITQKACADSYRPGYQGEVCKAVFSIKDPHLCTGEVTNCIINE